MRGPRGYRRTRRRSARSRSSGACTTWSRRWSKSAGSALRPLPLVPVGTGAGQEDGAHRAHWIGGWYHSELTEADGIWRFRHVQLDLRLVHPNGRTGCPRRHEMPSARPACCARRPARRSRATIRGSGFRGPRRSHARLPRSSKGVRHVIQRWTGTATGRFPSPRAWL